MLIYSKSDVWIGAKVILSNGQVAEVEDDFPHHEQIMVNVDGHGHFPVYVGETFDNSLYAKEVIPGQSVDPEPEPQNIDPQAEIFDGIDPNTFDGDMLDLF